MEIPKKTVFVFLTSLLLYIGVADISWASETVDNDLYADLLKKYVHNGVVDYHGFQNEEAKLDRYLKILEDTDTKTLSRNEKFTFYVNAYNAWTIKLILSKYPDIESIKDLGGFLQSPWKKKICRIDGDVLSLDNIEHDILRPEFKDPRIHFAVNCASKGCPPLRNEPYNGHDLEMQLDEMTAAFINNPKYNRLENTTLFVSSIFKWYSEDFNKDIPGFFMKYAQGNLKKELEEKKDRIKIKYLNYDWSLNGG